MSRRLDLLLTGAAGWIRSSLVGMGNDMNRNHDEGLIVRVPEAEIRATEIHTLLGLKYPTIHWSVTLEQQRRALVSGPLEQYVVVKGLRRDGTSMPAVRIGWRDATNTPASKLVRQIVRGLRLDT